MQKLIGVLVAIAGWLLTLSGLFMSSTNTGRAGFAVLGIAVSLFGIFGLINAAFLKTAIWKK
jgi:hypothetical protein